MTDTLVLRIHGVKRYRNILKSLDQLNTRGYTTSMAHVKGQDIDKLRSQGHKNTGEILGIMKMNGSGDFLVKAKFAKAPNSSGHYHFVYMVNYTKDYIELNFSIPKYVFGSNVLMFVDHPLDRAFSFHECWPLEYNLRAAFDRLRRFIEELFRFQFINVTVDPAHVEVHRIDVCFNQVFRSKEAALKYLEYQKRKSKKYSRDDGNRAKEYETSIMYVTKRYSAKIYHKGTEYRKHDLKEHLKFNQRKGVEYFKTSQFQAFADKILRYELTIRTDMLNYLHKHFLFRRKCPHFQVAYKEYQRVEAIKQKNDRIAERLGELPEEKKEAYRKEHPYEKVSKEAKAVHKYVSKLVNRRTHFTLAVAEEVAIYNRLTLPGKVDCNIAKFSQGLFELCLGKLVEFMQEFRIKELPEDGKVEKAIDEYNLRHRKKLPKNEMLAFYQDLLKIGSFKETARHNYMARATLYRYKERFRKIGITDNNLIPLTENGIPEAELNFREYHQGLIYDYPKLLTRREFLDLRVSP